MNEKPPINLEGRMSGKPLRSFTKNPGVDMEKVEADRRRRERGGNAELVDHHLCALSIVSNDPAVGGDSRQYIENLLSSHGVAVKFLGRYLPED